MQELAPLIMACTASSSGVSRSNAIGSQSITSFTNIRCSSDDRSIKKLSTALGLTQANAVAWTIIIVC